MKGDFSHSWPSLWSSMMITRFSAENKGFSAPARHRFTEISTDKHLVNATQKGY
jgi:hypothetical protein